MSFGRLAQQTERGSECCDLISSAVLARNVLDTLFQNVCDTGPTENTFFVCRASAYACFCNPSCCGGYIVLIWVALM